MIRADHLCFSHGKRPIISGLSTRFPVGEVHAILGANGAGKSTLLKLLAGELTPQQGNISLNGTPLAHFSPRELARIRAVLPQESTLHFPLTVHDIVDMGGYPFRNVSQLIAHCLGLTHTEHLADRAYLTLSRGEQQRVQLARTLLQVLAPAEHTAQRFLLLDEPTTSLDPHQQHTMLRLVQELARAHAIGVIIALHDVNLAAQYADQILLLANGTLLAHGPKNTVLTEAHLSAVYQSEVAIVPHPLFAQQPFILFR